MSHHEAHAMAGAATTAEPSARRHSAFGAELEDCITGCLACEAICLQTAYHCLELGGAHADALHVRRLFDCAALCEASVRFMTAESPFAGRICALCAEACRACEEACRGLGDESDTRCADACRRCAEMLPRAA